MTDFRTWIVGQSAKLGYDFNALTREDQENIISALLSYAEDAFRSQCDYPDMRFGKRRGIYASGDGDSEKDKKTNVNELFSGDTSTMSTAVGCSSNDANCTFSASCTNGEYSCTNNGCTNRGDGACTNTGGDGYFCTDNGCSNTATLGCNDDMGCIDLNTCSNTSGGGCADGASSSGAGVSCTDTGCSNKTGIGASKGCTDSINCVDEASCLNNSRVQNCIDNTGCKDNECDNRNSFGQKCLDDLQCKDDKCCNRWCTDLGDSNSACGDDVCSNCRTCEDEHCDDGKHGQGECGDVACINSGSKNSQLSAGCTDSAFCLDTPCMNFNQGCTDTAVGTQRCDDNGCSNIYPANCSDSSSLVCTDRCYTVTRDEDPTKCTNLCTNFTDCANAPASCHVAPPHNYPTDESKACIDLGLGCADITTCKNYTNCVDYKSGSVGCSDAQCTNSSRLSSMASSCQDYDGNCIDNSCSNTNGAGSLMKSMCLDDFGCRDNPCTNSRCIDISPTTTCNTVDSQCQITNTKCIVVGHREDTYDTQSGCTDTDPKACNANNPYDNLPGAECLDQDRSTCADSICDPPP